VTPCNVVDVSEEDAASVFYVEVCNRKPEAAHSPETSVNTARHMASHFYVKLNVLFSVLSSCAVQNIRRKPACQLPYCTRTLTRFDTF
jgi:hypothetical protein